MNEDIVQPTASTEATILAARDSMPMILAEFAECESRFSERFYEIFFEARPDALPLFGLHSITEQEEMIRETFRSLLAWAEHQPWLESNLDALGKSHWEYGVSADMYDSFVETMLECGRELVGDSLDDARLLAMRIGLEAVVQPMREAGNAAAKNAANDADSSSALLVNGSG